MSSYNISKSIKKWPYIFVTPYIILYALFGLFPILFSLYISFTNWQGIGEKRFVGLENYIDIFTHDTDFLKSIGNTMLLMAGSLPIMLTIPLIFATILYSKHVKYKRFFQLASFIPYITIPVSVGLMFSMLFDYKGIINTLLMNMKLIPEEILFLNTPWMARLVLILLIVWKTSGYYAVIYLAGLANIPPELLEAADVDGANKIQLFFRILVPLLKPVILFLTITGIIGGFQLSEDPMLLFTGWGTGNVNIGGPDKSCLTAVWYMFDTAFGTTMFYGKGAAASYGLFLFIVVFSLLGVKISNRKGEAL